MWIRSAEDRRESSCGACGPGEVRIEGVFGRWVRWASPVGDDSAEEDAEVGSLYAAADAKRPYAGEAGGEGEGEGVLLYSAERGGRIVEGVPEWRDDCWLEPVRSRGEAKDGVKVGLGRCSRRSSS